MLVTAGIAYWKVRKASLLVTVTGLALILVADGIRVAFPAPLHPAYVASLVVNGTGFVAAVTGFAWFMWKDYRGPKSAT